MRPIEDTADLQLLLVDDDVEIRTLMRSLLEGRGVDLTAVGDVQEGMDALRHRSFDIAVLDLHLPDGSGLDVLRALRSSGSPAHVIVLSGAAAEVDRVEALHLGADDYVVKPFFSRELAARISSVKRRLGTEAIGVRRFGDIELSLGSRVVTKAGIPVDLSVKEFELLTFFVDHPDRAFSRDELLRKVWHSAAEWQQSSTVTEHVRRLRGKLEVDPKRPVWLLTVHGVGYRFSPAGLV